MDETLRQRWIEQQIALAELALNNLRDLLSVNTTPTAAAADETGCEHPDDKRIDFSAMGITRWKCQACGFSYEKRIG